MMEILLVGSAMIVLSGLLLLFVPPLLGGKVTISEVEVGIVYKKLSINPLRRNLSPARLIALHGEPGYQAYTLATGLHYGYWSWQYNIECVPLTVIPPGQIGLVVAEDGQSRLPHQVLGRVIECQDFQDGRAFLLNGGQKGRQLHILPGGAYRINTKLFTVITSENAAQYGLTAQNLAPYIVEGGKIGIVSTLGGAPLPAGEIAGPVIAGHDNFQNPQAFIDAGGNRGLQEEYLSPGSYRLNPWFVLVKQISLKLIPAGTVGVVISHVGKTSETSGNLVESGYKGIWKIPLHSGLHPINSEVMDVVIVPTNPIALEWSNKPKPPDNYDANLRRLQLLSKDGFVFEIEVLQVIRVDAMDAPRMIASIGVPKTDEVNLFTTTQSIDPNKKYTSIRSLVVKILEPTIGSYFRNSAQSANALDFFERRINRQVDAKDHIGEALKAHGVHSLDTFINEIDLPSQLGKLLEARNIAEEELLIEQSRQLASETRQKLMQSEPTSEQRLFELDKYLAETKDFFQAAGLKLNNTNMQRGFVCYPNTPNWQRRLKRPVYMYALPDSPLDNEMVLAIYDMASQLLGDLTKAFVIVEQNIQDDAWLQIITLRAKSFDIIPIQLSTLLYKGKALGIAVPAEAQLSTYLDDYLSRSTNPYEIRYPVDDVLNFFGRTRLAKEIMARLLEGHPIGIFGLRKIGKTSLIKYIQQKMPCPTAVIDLQSGIQLSNVFHRILRNWALDAKAKPDYNLDFSLSNSQPIQTTTQFFNATQSILDRLSTNGNMENARLAIFLDEVDIIAPSSNSDEPAKADLALMKVLRSLVQEDGRLSLLVAGVDPSINRINRWKNASNPFYEFFQTEYVPSLSELDCKLMIRSIGRQINLAYKQDALDAVFEASGGHPALARQLCSLAFNLNHSSSNETSLDIILKAIERFLVDPNYSFLLDDNGLWGDICKATLWSEKIAQSSQDILLILARLNSASYKTLVESLTDPSKLDTALLVLEQLSIVKCIQQSSDNSQQFYDISIGLFRSWIRRRYLNIKE